MTVEWIRDDINELAGKLATEMVRKGEQDIIDARIAAETPRPRNTIEIRIYRHGPLWVAETVEPLPFGMGWLRGVGATEHAARAHLKFWYVTALLATKTLRFKEDAQDHVIATQWDVVSRSAA